MANVPLSALTTIPNTTGIGLTGYSLTAANAQSLLDMAGTWNTSGLATLLKFNVTNTASGAGSLLLDLQTGGASRFSVLAAGGVLVGAPTGGDKGIGTINATALYVNGTAIGATAPGGSTRARSVPRRILRMTRPMPCSA